MKYIGYLLLFVAAWIFLLAFPAISIFLFIVLLASVGYGLVVGGK